MGVGNWKILGTAPRPAAQNFGLPPGARAEAPDPNVPIYFEVASIKPNKDGGQGFGMNRAPGGSFKPSTDECAARPGGPRAEPATQQLQGPPRRADGTPIFCGFQQPPGMMRFNGLALSMFAQGISGRVGRQVVDRTGLAGEWSFELKYSSTPIQAGPAGAEPPPGNPDAPDLFTAVREQLGLRLEATKGPVEVWVVDSIERPTAD